jgi:hypothetical protein
MAIETTKEFDSLQLAADGTIYVCEFVVVRDGGAELARSILRTSYAPGSELPSDAPALARSLADLAWTPEVLAKAKAAAEEETTVAVAPAPEPLVVADTEE